MRQHSRLYRHPLTPCTQHLSLAASSLRCVFCTRGAGCTATSSRATSFSTTAATIGWATMARVCGSSTSSGLSREAHPLFSAAMFPFRTNRFVSTSSGSQSRFSCCSSCWTLLRLRTLDGRAPRLQTRLSESRTVICGRISRRSSVRAQYDRLRPAFRFLAYRQFVTQLDLRTSRRRRELFIGRVAHFLAALHKNRRWAARKLRLWQK